MKFSHEVLRKVRLRAKCLTLKLRQLLLRLLDQGMLVTKRARCHWRLHVLQILQLQCFFQMHMLLVLPLSQPAPSLLLTDEKLKVPMSWGNQTGEDHVFSSGNVIDVCLDQRTQASKKARSETEQQDALRHSLLSQPIFATGRESPITMPRCNLVQDLHHADAAAMTEAPAGVISAALRLCESMLFSTMSAWKQRCECTSCI